MRMLILCAAVLHAGQVSQDEGRNRASQLPPEIVECVVVSRIDAARADELLQSIFAQMKVKPRYALSAYTLPGERRAHLLCIKGKEAETAFVKKVIGAMEDAAGAGEGDEPQVLRLELKAVSAAEMKRRILDATARAGLTLRDEHLLVYPAGAGGALFFIGPREISSRVAEMSKGLDRESPPGRWDFARGYVRELAAETVKAFGALFSTVLSALILLVLHAVIARLPLIGKRYRRAFQLFWEKLFAAFKGKDLAWEIIKAAAELGVSASAEQLTEEERRRAAVAGAAAFGPERKSRALKIAREYARWRGLDPESPEVSEMVEAAVDAEASRALKGPAAA